MRMFVYFSFNSQFNVLLLAQFFILWSIISMFYAKITFSLLLSLFLIGCTSSIKPIGKIGPQELGVYSIAQNDFLSANRMLVIVNKKGELVAYTGGTVAGAGTVGLQTAGTLVTASAVLYGAKAIEHGLENAQVSAKGIPSNIKVNTSSEIHVRGLN